MKQVFKTKKRSSSNAFRILAILISLLILLPAAVIGYVIATFDINAYRTQISEAATEALGRKVELVGPIMLGFSLADGFNVALKDVTVANPSWASRPLMAQIGEAKLHVSATGLLQKKVSVVAFDLSKADVQLETSASGQNNWDFKKAASAPVAPKPGAKAESAPSKTPPVAVEVKEVSILDSRFAMRNKDGQTNVIDVPKLLFTGDSRGSQIVFQGSVSEVPAQLTIRGGQIKDLLGNRWPFALEASYANYKVNAKGVLSDAAKRVMLDPVDVSVANSNLNGVLDVNLTGVRPAVTGKLTSQRLDPKDFSADKSKEAEQVETATPAPAQEKGKGGKIFTRDPLPLDALKSVDAKVDVLIQELTLGVTPLTLIHLPVDLEGGRLSLAPFTFMMGTNKGEGKFTLDGSAPTARLGVQFASKEAELSQLVSLWGLESVISGKADVDLDLTSVGRSSYDFASNANGSLNVLMEKGTVSGSTLKEVAGALLQIFAPGVGSLSNPGINCLAGRYVIRNGLVETKGLLIDTEMTTIAGDGVINLPDEHVSMSLHTQPKGMGLGTAFPPMKIYGPLTSPTYTLDAGGVAKKVIGLLKDGVAPPSGVPVVVQVPGKNACAAALDNPVLTPAEESKKGVLLPSTGSLSDTVKGIGDKLKGLGGGLFGK